MPRVYRFFLNTEDSLFETEVLIKNKDLLQQMTKVLRLKSDSPEIIEFLDGSGKVFQSQIDEVSSKEARFIITKKYLSKRELQTKVVFLIPIIKMEAFEFMLRKLTELGVQSFIPIAFERSQKQNIAAVNSEKNKLRLNKIMQEAVEQCEGAILPVLCETISSDKIPLLFNRGGVLRIFASEKLADEPEQDLDQKIQLIKECQESKKIFLLVGPEGGLTDNEVSILKQFKFKDIGLGKRLLKAETAAISLFASLTIA